MKRSFEHKSPQFEVNATFESFSALKHAYTHAALLDLYEFDPVKESTTLRQAIFHPCGLQEDL